MLKKKTINQMNYDELNERKEKLLYERFLGIILLIALFLGILLLYMISDMQLLNQEFLNDYIKWNLSAYALIALGGLGIIQILLSTVDYHKCLNNLKKIIDKEGGDIL